ncbi:MAG TPA: amidohydrolase family protein [Dehalococcoidia bacterium]|nr:amidohydrolase family protein [Dehalococcoidia bacterium]
MVATKVATIIDGDGHIWEDDEAIIRHLPARYACMYRGGPVFPKTDHLHIVMGATPPGAFRVVGPDGWQDFLQDLGLNATVLYPSGGLTYGRIVNRDWAIAVTRAYNDWLAETYLRASTRFKGMALIPLQEPAAAVEELRHAVRDLGMVGAMLPATGLSQPLGEKQFWPVYEEAERLGCCLGIHGGAHIGMGLDHFNVYPAVHAMGHPFSILINFGSIVFNGIFDKYPGVRVGFMEAGTGWLLFAMERYSGSYASHIADDPRDELLRLRPGEKISGYIQRQIEEGRIFVGMEGDELTLAHAVKVVGNKPFIYSSDFPHEVTNETCREEIEELLENEELSEEDKQAILHGNAERFYSMKVLN